MLRRFINVAVTFIIIIGFFLIMSNLKHEEILSVEEEESIKVNYDSIQQSKVKVLTETEKKLANEQEIEALFQALKDKGTIEKGENGKDVETLQRLLGLDADGVFEFRTEQTVIDFQWRHGLVADGVIGFETLEVLLDSL